MEIFTSILIILLMVGAIILAIYCMIIVAFILEAIIDGIAALFGTIPRHKIHTILMTGIGGILALIVLVAGIALLVKRLL